MALPNNPTQAQTVKAIKDLETNKVDSSALSSYLPKSGGTMTGALTSKDITLYSASGDSPRLTFQRGTLTDTYNDWSIYDTAGLLHIQQRGSGSSAWEDRATITQSGATFVGTLNAGTLQEGGTNLSNKYLGKTATATDSAKLDGQASSYYLDYNNFANTPTIPSAVTESTVSGWGFTKNAGTITGVQLNGTTVASSGVANVQALPNFSLNISHQTAGNPRPVKFLTVNYNTAATYFKMSATSCHDNGTSYQFLEDIIIGCTTSGTVVCNVYKYCQQAVTYDGATRNYGDVFYVIDTTNKKVDFFILCGQWASSQFTPATKIGNTTIAYITQHTGTATYYSSGTKVWASGDSTTYARLSDIPDTSGLMPKSGGTFTGDVDWSGSSQWLKPYLIAFKNADTSSSPAYPYTGFYQWGAEWQVNARDANNAFVHNLLTINNSTKAAEFAGSVSAPSFYATSDRRLKENIKPAELDCGKVIDDLQIKEFNFIDDEEKKVIVGAIAQELQEILPEKYRATLVSGSEDTSYSISEGKLLFVAIGALKEERAKTKELEERLAKLEKMLGV